MDTILRIPPSESYCSIHALADLSKCILKIPTTSYMPFFMVYGAKVILPTDLDYGALRVMEYKEQEAKEFLEDTMDQFDEARDVALLPLS
jgi:hypothetical protein